MRKKRTIRSIFSKNRGRMEWTALLKLLLFSIVLLLAPVSCNQPFDLVESLDGPDGIALTLSPASSQVIITESATLSGSGGIPPYTFSVISGSGTIVASTGVYTAPGTTGTDIVQVTDSYGATATASVNIISGGGPVPLSISPTTISINGGNSVTFNASGGTGPYTYSLQTSITGSGELLAGDVYTAPGDTAGTAVVRVTDSLLATADASVIVTVIAIPPLSISPASIDLNLSDSISLSASGGEAPYTFTLLTSITGTGESLAGSTYTAPSDNTGTATVQVTDNIGTTTNSSIIVSPATVLTISPSTIVVNLNGTIDFSASGGVPPFAYSLFAPLTGTGEDLTVNTYTAPSDTTGNATVRVTDNIGSTVDATVTVSAPIPLSISPVAISLNLTESIALSASGGVPPYTYSLLTPITGTGENITVGGLYTAPSDNTGVATVRVTDNMGTTADSAITVNPGTPTVLAISPATITLNLAGSIDLSASGGVPPYAYSIITPITGTGENLIANTYTAPSDNTGTATMRVTDNVAATSDATITVTPAAVLSISPVTVSLNLSDSIDLSASGGVPPYAYSLLTPITGTGESLIANTYTAPSDNTGTATIRITDNIGVTDDATITVTPASALAISPTAVSLNLSENVILSASGGVPPYTYSLFTPLTGTGEDLTANVYTAPSDTSGNATVRVSDNVGITADATISVLTPPDIDYIVTAGSITANNDPAVGGSAISESFTITNNGTDNGSTTVYWTAYISTDNAFDNPGDTPIDSGQTNALGTGAVSAAINIDNGSWPTVGSTTPYYLFVDVSSSDELPANIDAGNQDSSLFSITVPDIDYQVTSVTNANASAESGTAISENFVIENVGGDAGSSTVLWTAYASSDLNLNTSVDTYINSGTIPALGTGGSSGNIALSGTWASSGAWYILVRVSASDETTTSNNVGTSGLFSISAPAGNNDIDYIVTSVSSDFLTVTTGSPVSETFSISNIGDLNGVDPVNWNVYASTDAIYGGDTLIGSGTTTALNAGASSFDIPVNADWGGGLLAGEYFLFVSVNTTDETIATNNDNYSGPFTLYDPPDYSVVFDTSVVNLGQTGLALSGSPTFTITNDEPLNDGMNPITWRVYYSTDKILSGDDMEMDTGVETALQGSGSTQPTFSGTWPAAGNFYFLILTIGADDDENLSNNQTISIPIAVGDQIFEEVELNDNSTGTWDTGSTKTIPAPLNECLTGTTLALSGTMDGFNGFDVFGFPMDNLVNSLDILVRWETGYDDIDFHLYFDTGTEAYNPPNGSIDASIDSEPASVLSLNVSSLNTDEILYFGINFWLANNTSGSTGEPYSVLLTFNN